jgi:osmotically-inducible protein OsmY
VLLGDVESPTAKHAADDDAWAVPGVVQVDNRLNVAA